MADPRSKYLFSVDEYERMGEVGILGEDDRVELIYGEIEFMSPIGGPHLTCVNRATRSLTRQTDGDLYYVCLLYTSPSPRDS